MADAVGHGIPAALLTMFIKNALVTKQILADGYRLLAPGESLARVNESLIGQNLSYAQFATAIYGYINTETLELSFGRGGHPKPIVLRADGTTINLDADGSLLGIFADEVFTTSRIQLAPGDRVLIYSDGVEVAFTPDQSVDVDRWHLELQQRRHLNGEQLIGELSHLLDNAHGSLSPKDDLTVILAEVA
jgi:sigma-B regulation protein RsbU (phosphoserine phosphatase)